MMSDKQRFINEFGEHVRTLRRRAKLTQKETGEHEPLLGNAVKIAQVLDISIDALMDHAKSV